MRSIEPGRIQALGEIVNGSGADGVLASNSRPGAAGNPRTRLPGVPSWP
jgi:hypothetical protein